MNWIMLQLFKWRHRLKPDYSLNRDKFIYWLKLLGPSRRFSMSYREDPITEFLFVTTREPHIAVGLDWYSFQEYKLRHPITEVHALPKWASGLMWDKSLKTEFSVRDIFLARKDLK